MIFVYGVFVIAAFYTYVIITIELARGRCGSKDVVMETVTLDE